MNIRYIHTYIYIGIHLTSTDMFKFSHPTSSNLLKFSHPTYINNLASTDMFKLSHLTYISSRNPFLQNCLWYTPVPDLKYRLFSSDRQLSSGYNLPSQTRTLLSVSLSVVLDCLGHCSTCPMRFHWVHIC